MRKITVKSGESRSARSFVYKVLSPHKLGSSESATRRRPETQAPTSENLNSSQHEGRALSRADGATRPRPLGRGAIAVPLQVPHHQEGEEKAAQKVP